MILRINEFCWVAQIRLPPIRFSVVAPLSAEFWRTLNAGVADALVADALDQERAIDCWENEGGAS